MATRTVALTVAGFANRPARAAESMQTCSFDGCEGTRIAKGLCWAHYQQQRRGVQLKPTHPRRTSGMSTDELAAWILARLDRKPNGCWEWTGRGATHGNLQIGYEGRSHSIRRIVLAHSKGFPADKSLRARSTCGNQLCARPEHIAWASRRSILTDRIQRGRHGACKLSADDVRAIRRRLDAGDRQVDIARDYGVAQTCISGIKRGATWRHLA